MGTLIQFLVLAGHSAAEARLRRWYTDEQFRPYDWGGLSKPHAVEPVRLKRTGCHTAIHQKLTGYSKWKVDVLKIAATAKADGLQKVECRRTQPCRYSRNTVLDTAKADELQ